MLSIIDFIPEEAINTFVKKNKAKILYVMGLLVVLPHIVFIAYHFGNIQKILENIEMTVLSFIIPLPILYPILRLGAIFEFSKENFRRTCWFFISLGLFGLGIGILSWIISLGSDWSFGIYISFTSIVVPYHLKEKYGK